MHDSVLAWVAERTAELDLSAARVLEVGSYNVNGSVRSLFEGAESYCGVDHADGPGVDLVMDACDLPWLIPSFDVVVSTEMLEHCERPWVAVAEMGRVLHDDGVLLLSCRGFNERGSFPHHNPPDHYRFSSVALVALCLDAGFAEIEVIADPQVPGWFVTAAKSAFPSVDAAPGTATPGPVPT